MKRSIYLFFAFMLFFAWASDTPVCAQPVFSNGSLILLTDNDGNGYPTVGDVIRVQVTATTSSGLNWGERPNVNLSPIGQGVVYLNNVTGDIWRADITLNQFMPTVPNFTNLTLTISAIDIVTGTTNVTLANVDIVQVDGNNAHVAPPITPRGGSITITINDGNYQGAPNGGTIATVDLRPIGGANNTPMVSDGAGGFTLVYAPPNDIEYHGPLTITLKDPFYPAQTYQTNFFTVDTIPPLVDFAGTNVVIMSGNATALPGDVLRITARVNAFDNETVEVQSPSLNNTVANPPIDTAVAMPIINGGTIASPTEWRIDVVLSEGDLKNTSLPITFRFTDDAGNVVIVTRYIPIDLDSPSFVNLSADVRFPDSSDSPCTVATTSCQIKFVASIPIDVPPDTLTVTADMSPIGGTSAMTMTQNLATGNYEGVYIIPAGTLEDTVPWQFVISAKDAAGNLVARLSAPPVTIDSNAPVISSLLFTAPDTYLTVGDTFTISLNVDGIEQGSVSVDLSQIGMSANEIIPSAGGNSFSRSFTLQTASITGVIRDAYTSFKVTVNDTVASGGAIIPGHYVSQNTTSIWVDNEPAIITEAHINTYHKWYPADDFGYVRVGDYLSFHAKTASAPVSVKINMSGLGGSPVEPMIASGAGNGWYDYRIPTDVATGTVNGANVIFSISATDDAGNVTFATLTVPIDNQPVDVGGIVINTSYKPGRTDNDFGIINLNKHLDINVPFTTPIPDDAAATGSIDLTSIGQPSNVILSRVGSNYTISTDTLITDSFHDLSGYRYQAVIHDNAGNRTVTQSPSKTVDCYPPSILSATVTIMSGAGAAKIGDDLKFEAQVADNESTAPTVDLSSLGGATDQVLTFNSITGKYEYTMTIATGTIDGSVPASWSITAWDNAQNYVSSSTNAITVDNVPPQVSGGLVVTWVDNPVDNIIKIGDSTTFVITVTDPSANVGAAVLDLSAMGGPSNLNMNKVGNTFSANFTGTQTNAEYTDYIFKAKVTDANGNLKIVSAPALGVDCQATSFSSDNIYISENNSDNPFTTIANVNDVLTIYASASAYMDATVYATIASGTTDFATATMVLNPTLNRHEVTFTVSPPGINNWPDMGNSKVTYKLTALDDAGNIATMTVGTSTFTVRNATPTIAIATFTFSPNEALQYAGTLPVLNIASSSPVDAMNASIQLANGDPIYEAKVDLSDFGASDVSMSINGASATTATGIAANNLPPIDYVQKNVSIFVKDEGGMTTSTSTTIIVDNVAPKITSAEFDGKIFTVNVSEEISNVDLSQWQIVGSNPLPLDTPAYLSFSNSPNIGLFSFNVTLTQAEQQTLAQWASTPLYIQVSNASAPLTDRAENWMEPENYHPVTITDSSWREDPRVTKVAMDQNWPNSIEINVIFNKDIDPTTLVASSGVLLVSNINYDFTNPDYTVGYIFQPTDTVSWPSPRNLRITLSPEGRDWVAAKLTNDTSVKLRFATRSSAHIFAYDTFRKVMEAIPTSDPIVAVDNRPVPAFDIYGPPFEPVLDIASRTLVLHVSDRVRLFSDDFGVLDINDPRMASPTPTLGQAVTTFHNNILFHDIDKGTNTTFAFENLEIPADNAAASSTITLKLTDQDLRNVFNLYLGNTAPVWRLQVNSAAFHNWWGTPNNAYMPSGQPGQMKVVAPTGYNPATFAACSMSDLPPFNQHNATELVFEVEVSLPDIDGVEVPIQSLSTPTAKIIRQDTAGLLTTGTFVNWTTRVVDGENRAVARFYNATSFPDNLQAIPSQIEVNGILDIFGNSYSVVASHAFDLNTKNDGSPQGFSDIASVPIVIDTRLPLVTSVSPATAINVIPAGTPFTVTYDEPMDTTVAPSLRLATSTFIMGFTFSSWISSTTAQFVNNSAFTSATLNGTWNYEVTGGQDEASNLHVGPTIFPVQVRTHPPEIQIGRIHLKTVQNIIDSSETLTDQPWGPSVPNLTANFSIEYDSIPTEYLPHWLKLYDANGNFIGQSIITTSSTSTLATATFSTANFFSPPGAVGPVTYGVRVVDAVLNETATISTIVYDDVSPDLTTFDVTNIGSSTGDVIYYSQNSGDFGISVITGVATDDLRLALYSYADNATTTYNLTQFMPNKYSLGMGGTLANGSYTLTIVDMAGNVGTGLNSKTLIADKDRPTVVSIEPLDGVGNAPAGAQQFKVMFSEPMDADAAYLPALTLATGSTTIGMTFSGWADPNVASTAIYVNTNAITSAIPVGTYTYRVIGGKDLAHNDLISPADMDFAVTVYSQGPVAIITNLTLQSHLYPLAQTGLDFNPAFGNGSATLNINYAGGPFYTPHDLTVFDSSGIQIGTSTANLPIGDPVSIYFPTDITWEPGHPTDGTYYFRIRDAGGNMIPTNFDYPIVYDTVAPSVSAFDIHNSFGIATDTGMGTMFHYSPTLGNATCDVTSSAADKMKMVVLATGTMSTYTLDMSQGAALHTVDFGNVFPNDGCYIVTAADYAGNMAGGTAPSVMMCVDRIAPFVTNAMPIIAGGIPAGTGIFDVTFNEPMNTTSATSPVLIIATNSAVLNMTFQSWVGSETCRFTNAVAIDDSLPVGTYSYHISGAVDLAGNPNVDPSSGTYEIQLFTTPPAFTAELRSQQNLLYGTTELINKPFSINAAPGVATLSVSYTEGPFQVPHSVLVYDSSNVQVASIALNPDVSAMKASATVDAAFFGSPGNVGPSIYSFKLVDQIGNVSATSSTLLTYDAFAPDIQVATITTVSNATNTFLYYNDQLYGDLNVDMQTDATDDLLMTIASAATYTYAMTSGSSAGKKSVKVPASTMAAIPEGIYTINAFDLAGNAGYGAAANKTMIIDRTAPTVTGVTVTGGAPVTSAPIGMATFTITFNEPMNQLASATPVVTLATTSKIINFTFSSWLSATQAQFVNAEAITPDVPQGDYRCSVTAYDVTGNKASIYSAATIAVRSRGPVVSKFVTHSFQQTTASDSTEIKTDMPFSFAINSGVSTMSIQLAAPPDTLPTNLHFMLNNVTVASYPIVFDASNAATFTWSATNGPVPTGPTTYIIKLTDGDDDFSLESYSWTMDASAPVVMTPTIEGGEVATSAVYFNPSKHGYITAKFSSVETDAPLLRVCGANSTDTYQMSAAGTNMWAANYDGRYSRGGNPKPLAPDGIYTMTMVDKAGNVGEYNTGGQAVATFVIDTAYPGISTYTLTVAGVPTSRFAPAAGNLDITLVSPEPLSETGVFWINVLNSSGIEINKLPLTLAGTSYVANWDGTDKNGNKVIDGSYKFLASDYAGNVATGSIGVDVVASSFRVIGAEEISATSVKLWFSQNLDAATIGGAVVDVTGGLTASAFTIAEPQALVMTLNSPMIHNTSYTFTVATGTVNSVYGAGIAGPDNVGILVADSQGPIVSDVTFDGLSGQQEFKVVFDEAYKATTASDITHYTLTGPTGNVAIVNATIQSDQKTVLLTAATELVERANYTITVTDVEDALGNKTPSTGNSYDFVGRDLTPPVLEVGVFSNPINEYDIIVVVTSNEGLQAPPTLQIGQSNAPVINTTMQQGSASTSYMIGVHLSPSYPGNGSIVANGIDLAGNTGTGNATFAVAYVASKRASYMFSSDKHALLKFDKASLKSDSMVKIFNHKLKSDNSGKSSVRTSMKSLADHALGNIRASAIDPSIAQIGQSELVPTTQAYEIGIDDKNINNGFKLEMATNATETVGLGLFRQNGDAWKFVSANRTAKNNFYASLKAQGIYAILKDIKPAVITMSPDIDLSEPFKTDKPEFKGKITDSGSGLDITSVRAIVDSGPEQMVSVSTDGSFVFKSLAALTGGKHTLVIKCADNTGNVTLTPAMNFEVIVPLNITQIIQYPNPARRKTFIRMSANRSDVLESLIRVRIYDVSGHKVRNLDGIKAVRENWGINSRYLYDIPWDLKNERGRTVANGVYFAKIEIHDPDNPGKKIKRIQKLAVLR